jgi:hypothetical protein
MICCPLFCQVPVNVEMRTQLCVLNRLVIYRHYTERCKKDMRRMHNFRRKAMRAGLAGKAVGVASHYCNPANVNAIGLLSDRSSEASCLQMRPGQTHSQ